MKKLKSVIKTLKYITGSATLTDTMKIVFKALADEGIPALYCGGLAVHVYGWERTTGDLDIIIPNTYRGQVGDEILWQTLKPSFNGAKIDFKCKQTGGDVDVLYGGNKMQPERLLTLPTPTKVTSKPTPISIEWLIGLKLDAYRAEGIDRVKDLGDVVELIKINQLPRDMDIPNDTLKEMYVDIWDDLHKKKITKP